MSAFWRGVLLGLVAGGALGSLGYAIRLYLLLARL